jgi:hypothetical protein
MVDRDADDVLAWKGNPETLHPAVMDRDPIDEQRTNDFATVQARRPVSAETAHGREEIRRYLPMPVPPKRKGLEAWKGLKSMGMVTLACVRNGKPTRATRYDISSWVVGVKQFARAVRSHGGSRMAVMGVWIGSAATTNHASAR